MTKGARSQDTMALPPAGQPGHGSTAILRNQPVRTVDGRFEGCRIDVYELVCPSCGDDLHLDFSEVHPRLQWLRGPRPLEAALAAYHKHLGLPWSARTEPEARSWPDKGQAAAVPLDGP